MPAISVPSAAAIARLPIPSILNYANPRYNDVRTYVGDPQVPPSIKRLRVNTGQTMQRFGNPVLLKRMYTIEDVEKGIAIEATNFDTVYGSSTYATDYISYGVGFASVDTQGGEWIDIATGNLVIAPVPSSGYLPAPKYRGYGPGFLAYAILPDRPEDAWKLTPQGALVRQQQALVQLPWWPQLGDNDLLITCRLNPNGTIAQTYERYQLKMVTPITMRGADRRGEREFDVNAGGNRYWINQQAELIKLPPNDIKYHVEVDR